MPTDPTERPPATPSAVPGPTDAVAASSEEVTGRRPLTRSVIVETALSVAERDGLDGLSMRRVATELGVGPMSLYNHVADKEALLLAMAEVVLASPPWQGATWQEALVWWASGVRARVLRWESMVAVVVSPLAADAARAMAVEAVTELVRRGLPPDEAVVAVRSVARYLAGCLVLDHGPVPRVPPGGGRPEALDHADDTPLDVVFREGLEALVAGLAQRPGAR